MKFEERSFNLIIPAKAWKKLDKYGYDYEKNFTELLRKVYFEICRCEEENKNEIKK